MVEHLLNEKQNKGCYECISGDRIYKDFIILIIVAGCLGFLLDTS